MQLWHVLQHFHSAVTNLQTGRMVTDNIHSHTDHFMTKCPSIRNPLSFQICSYLLKIRVWGQALWCMRQ